MVTTVTDSSESAGSGVTARARRAADDASSLRDLNDRFRAGHIPSAPLDGPYMGELIATAFGRPLDAAFGALSRVYMPWRGKIFDATASAGGNLFTARSKPLIRPFDPAVRDDRPGLAYAYPFATSTGAGVVDRDRDVLKIDYDLPANPFGLIRRVLDELVEVAPGYYLGKAHLRVGGRWRTVAYFALHGQ